MADLFNIKGTYAKDNTPIEVVPHPEPSVGHPSLNPNPRRNVKVPPVPRCTHELEDEILPKQKTYKRYKTLRRQIVNTAMVETFCIGDCVCLLPDEHNGRYKHPVPLYYGIVKEFRKTTHDIGQADDSEYVPAGSISIVVQYFTHLDNTPLGEAFDVSFPAVCAYHKDC